MIYGPAYSSKSRVNVQSMETSREMLVEQLRKALSDLSSRLCQLHRLPPDKCQPPLRTLYKDWEICKYKLQTCVYKHVTWRIWMWRTPRKFFHTTGLKPMLSFTQVECSHLPQFLVLPWTVALLTSRCCVTCASECVPSCPFTDVTNESRAVQLLRIRLGR